MADVHTTRRMDEAEEKDHLMQLVGFMNGKEMFGVDILMVQEIIRGAPITAVPNTPAFVEGVTNLRGNIIPVIDLRRRLSLPTDREKSGKNWVLILDIAGRVTGFVVDAVTEVLKIERDSIEPPPKSSWRDWRANTFKGFAILVNACSSCSISIVFCWWRKSSGSRK